MSHKKIFLMLCAMMLFALPITAQDMVESNVTVADQVITNGMVVIDEIISNGPGWMVIHADNDSAPGAIIGVRAVNDGVSKNVAVAIDESMATATLWAMLHVDDNEIGEYEFGTVEGADAPARFSDGQMVAPWFLAEIVTAYDQIVTDSITISDVVISSDGWVVVHADNGEGRPGPVLGTAPVTAGYNSDIVIALEGDITERLFPMLHFDTGEAGEYEFGTVEGADLPVALNGRVATARVETRVPTLRALPQLVEDSVLIESALFDGDAWIVIHADNGEGAPGPIIGTFGFNGSVAKVEVPVDAEGVTNRIFPMLHVDDGVVGEYEFGTVEGADAPVVDGDRVVVFGIPTVPSIAPRAMLDGNMLRLDNVLTDAQSWMVVHADNGEGAPGPILGVTPLVAGNNRGVQVELEGDITDTLFPMLHVDDGVLGEYEFGTVEGADAPAFVGEMMVVIGVEPEIMPQP